MGRTTTFRRLTGYAARLTAAGTAIISLTAAAPPTAPACGRVCLDAVMTRYLAGLATHDPGRAALTADVRSSENALLVKPGEGLWRSFTALGPYRMIFADPVTQQVAFLGNARVGDSWTMLAIRLHVRDGRAADEAEMIVPGASASSDVYDLSSGAGRLTTARSALTSPLRPSERRDRSQLIQAADLHYEGIERGNGDIVPFGERCIKIENGIQTILNPDFKGNLVSPAGTPLPNFQAMGCRDQFNTGVWKTDTITARRYPLVDEERGVVVVLGMFNQFATAPCADTTRYGVVCPAARLKPFSLAMVEAFRVRNGLIEEVESIFTVLDGLHERGVW